ncbi:alpha/beta fold hydrolase [Agromyces seonyuensis]|uniref:Alpha/beta fold hydrolase n=1 Tax=Agromyces seonyuensis TaxID=2662446 RepID=A0A6I4NZQ4_9MICO|nr:alpha/beta hydrolase [Agromyces seonyuensis]MWB98722.1 alpha/beta fold hydrolase [Agromyces seonyuensis]
MSEPQQPTVVLVHGAFAESASWNGVIRALYAEGVVSTAVANPLRGLAGDAAYVRDVIASIEGPVVLVGHSYGGLVISEASAGNDRVAGLVYVSAFTPSAGESAFSLSASEPGSTLGDAIVPRPLAGGGVEFAIDRAKFRDQFAADVDVQTAGLMGATQRPVTEAALRDPVQAVAPGWTDRPSWHVWGAEDRNIPAAVARAGAERAGARAAVELAGASHATPVSRPEEVAALILQAVRALADERVAA